MDLIVQHDIDATQFFVVVEGTRCVLDYQLQGKRMSITHTGVPAAVGGRGIAAMLTRAALNHARSAGWTVLPQCSYAIEFIQRHPEYTDLVYRG